MCEAEGDSGGSREGTAGGGAFGCEPPRRRGQGRVCVCVEHPLRTGLCVGPPLWWVRVTRGRRRARAGGKGETTALGRARPGPQSLLFVVCPPPPTRKPVVPPQPWWRGGSLQPPRGTSGLDALRFGRGGHSGGGVHLTSRFLGCCGVPPTPPEEAPALGPRQVSPSVGVEEEKLGRAGFRGGFSSACPALDPQEMSGGGGSGVWVHPRDLGGEGCCRFTVYPPKKSRGARGDDDEDDEDDVESDIGEY